MLAIEERLSSLDQRLEQILEVAWGRCGCVEQRGERGKCSKKQRLCQERKKENVNISLIIGFLVEKKTWKQDFFQKHTKQKPKTIQTLNPLFERVCWLQTGHRLAQVQLEASRAAAGLGVCEPQVGSFFLVVFF